MDLDTLLELRYKYYTEQQRAALHNLLALRETGQLDITDDIYVFIDLVDQMFGPVHLDINIDPLIKRGVLDINDIEPLLDESTLSVSLYSQAHQTFKLRDLNSENKRFNHAYTRWEVTRKLYSIDALDLSTLYGLTGIGDAFLKYHPWLTTIYLRDLPNLTHIGSHFLNSMIELDSCIFDNLPALQFVGDNFLYDCDKLTYIDLKEFAALTTINNGFLMNCNLTTLDLSPFSNVVEIKGDFLSQTKSLNTVDLSPLVAVKQIGTNFLSGSAVVAIDLSPLTQLRTLQSNAFNQCPALVSFKLKNLPHLSTIGQDCLSSCPELKCLELNNLPSLHSISRFFGYLCRKLNTAKFIELRNLKFIDPGFFNSM